MNTITDVRKAIKPLGYNIKTIATSWGRSATYTHIASGDKLSFNVFTPELLLQWKPLLDWLTAHREELRIVRENEGVIGLVK